MTQPTNIDYKQKCLDIYYASDVCDRSLTEGCRIGWEYPPFRAIYFGQVMYEDEESNEVVVLTNSYVKKGVSKNNIHTVYGHPPTLASWLRLVQGKKSIAITQTGSCIEPDNTRNGTRPVDLSFNLTTEEPTDWQKLYEIIQ